MANLKDLRIRISSIRSTQKITTAMKLVAGVKFRKAEAAAKDSRPYSHALQVAINYIASCHKSLQFDYPTLIDEKQIIDPSSKNQARNDEDPLSVTVIIYASDKGLCGSFNTNIVKKSISQIGEFKKSNVKLKIICIGTKIAPILRRVFADLEIKVYTTQEMQSLENISRLARQLIIAFKQEQTNKVYVLYSYFHTAIHNTLKFEQVLPTADVEQNTELHPQIPTFEVDERILIKELIEHNLIMQLRQASLESCASEHGIRMSAMDGATKNAQELLDKLILTYNRTRQSVITNELIEVISGAEAL